MSFRPQFTFRPRLQRQIIAVERTRGFLEAVHLRPDWHADLRQQVQVDDALANIALEGHDLSIEAAYKLLAQAPTSASPSEQAFLNAFHAFRPIDDLRGDRSYQIGLDDVRALHQALVDGQDGVEAGALRSTALEGAPPPDEVGQHLEELLAWVEEVKIKPTEDALAEGAEDPWIHPVLVAGIALQRFSWIQPFAVANGTTARLFATALLYIRGYEFKYLFNLCGPYADKPDTYHQAMGQAQRTGDFTRWLEVFTGGFSTQMFAIQQRAREAVEGLAEDDIEITTEVALPVLNDD